MSAMLALGVTPAGATPLLSTSRWAAPAPTKNGLIGFGSAASLPLPVSAQLWAGTAPTPSGKGAWMVPAGGNVVVAVGDATELGRTDQIPFRAPVVGTVPAANGAGYWIVGADGAVLAFGSALYHGSVPALLPGDKVVGLAATPDAGGYWLATSSGKVIAYGSAATPLGAAIDKPLTAPVVAIASTSTGGGYWVVTADGHVLSFGDAVNRGSATSLARGDTVVGIAPTADNGGYWLATANGSVQPYGDAPWLGSLAGWTHSPVVGIAASKTGKGYLLTTAASPAPAPIVTVAKVVKAAPVAYAARPRVSSAPVYSAGIGGVWACIRQHESGGNYATNTGNGYYGAYQFLESTWLSVGGTGLPSQAAPAVQDHFAQVLQARSGWSQWSTAPSCGV